jgi:hypothetical protein
MPDINDVYRALIKADAAGDKESAKQLADYIRQVHGTPQPKEEEASPLKTFAKEAGLGVVPGLAAAPGAEIGAAIGAVGGPIGSFVGALVGGGISAYGASKAQEAILESAPDLSKALGVDPEELARERAANPIAAKTGQVAGQLASFRPSLSQLGTREGLKIAGVNAVAGGISDIAQQEMLAPEGTPLDLKSAAESAALGALLNKPTALGRRAMNVGRRLTGQEPIPAPGEEGRETAPPEKTEDEKLQQLLLTYQPAEPKAVQEEVPVDRRAALEARMRELREATPQAERPKTAWETEFPEEAAPPEPPAPRKDMTVQGELPLGEEQMGFDFEGQPQREVGVAEPQMYVPAEEALKDFSPGTSGFKQAAKLLNLRLDRKGNLKPDQFVFQRPETETAPGQEALDFNYRTPEERAGIASQLSEDQRQLGFDFPGVPIERLTPRDQLLRAFDITEKRNIKDLADVLGWKYGQASREITALKKEGAVTYDPSTKEWSLTPAGEKRVYTRPTTEPRSGRRGPKVSVPERGAGEPGTSEAGRRGVEDTGEAPQRVDEGTEPGKVELTPEQLQANKEQNMQLFREIYARKQEQKPQNEANNLRTRAIDAYAEDQISERVYRQINDELKKSVPNLERARALLEGTEETAAPKRMGKIGMKLQRAEVGERGAVPHEQVEAIANDATKGWTNPPKVVVARDANDPVIPEQLRAQLPEDSPGFYKDGTTYVISDRAKDEAGIRGTVFHESLGHYGLQQEFRGGLNDLMQRIYDGNGKMREAAKQRMEKHGLDAPTAVEEILAERSEARVSKEPWLRDAYNRAVAYVRNFLRKMGLVGQYSDNDIAQILNQAHRRVTELKNVPYDPFNLKVRYQRTPAEQQKGDRDFIQNVGTIPSRLPKATKQTIEGARNAASNVPGATRRGLFSSLNLHQLAEMYREVPVEVNGKVQRVKITDALDNMWTDLNKEGAAFESHQKAITDNLQGWEKIMSRFSQGERDRINRILLDTTAKQVEVLDLKDSNRNIDWKSNKSNSLYNEFKSLPSDVKKMYQDLRLAYLDYARGVEEQLKQYMTPSEWQKFQSELNAKRLQVYLPLFRTGDYRLTYTDKNNEYHSRRFESARERDMAMEEASKDGATNIERPLDDKFDMGTIPPTSFFGRVVGALNKNKSLSSDAKNKLIEQVVDLYMDYLPTNSVLQLARKREGTAGYVNDVLRGYANVAPSYARRLTNLEYMPKINESAEQFTADMKSAVEKKLLDSDVASDLVGNVAKQMNYIQNPNVNSIASKAAYFSYLTYLGGNLSTAAINLIDIPMVALSKLGGAHGFGKAGAKLIEAGRQYVTGNLSPETKRVVDRALKEGVLRTHQLQDIANFKKYGEGLDTLRVRTERILNWAFAKSDMFNRETTLMASYELNKQRLSKTLSGEALENAAFKQAARDVYSAFGSSFPKAAPPLMGNGLAKTALTFKRYNLNRTWLLYKAFKEASANEAPEVQAAARKELLGYFGSAYVFAGVKGLPLVGGGMTLAALMNGMFGDKDDPQDLQEMLKSSVGMFNYKGPINYTLNLDIASRTGWDGMFWRDDPKRMADVGPVTYAMEQFLGPTYSYALGVPRAVSDLQEGNYMRAFEKMAPRVVGNVSKSIRYATDGATTADGVPIVKNVSAYNKFMQAVGFAPDDIAEARESAGAAKGLEKKLVDRRNAIIARMAMAKTMGDENEFQDLIKEAKRFNEKVPTFPITGDSIRGAMVRHQRKMLESVNGVTVNRRLAPKIYSEVYNEDEEED